MRRRARGFASSAAHAYAEARADLDRAIEKLEGLVRESETRLTRPVETLGERVRELELALREEIADRRAAQRLIAWLVPLLSLGISAALGILGLVRSH